MFKKLTTRELTFLALMGAALFSINLLGGGALVAATGVPLASGLFTGLAVGLVAALVIKIVPKFGSVTILFTLYSILELPTALGGAPGFWPKVPINAISALLGDIWFQFTEYRTWSIFPAFYLLAAANLALFVFFLWLLGLPGVEKTLQIVHILILAYWVMGTIGIFVGLKVHKRIKNHRIVKMLEG